MHCSLIILKKTNDVFDYLNNKLNFYNLNSLVVFSDQNTYYAIFINKSDNNKSFQKLRDTLQSNILSENPYLAHGDFLEDENQTEYEYKLSVFPIRRMKETKAFYQCISDDIAQSFLRYNHILMDYDFICEDANQLFVFTKTIKQTGLLQQKNEENPKQRFPEFYSRLDQLVTEDIGKSISIQLELAHDFQYRQNSARLFSTSLPLQMVAETNATTTNSLSK